MYNMHIEFLKTRGNIVFSASQLPHRVSISSAFFVVLDESSNCTITKHRLAVVLAPRPPGNCNHEFARKQRVHVEMRQALKRPHLPPHLSHARMNDERE